jgi:phage-related protein
VLTVSGLASQVTYDTETGFALDGSGNDLTPTVSLSEWPLALLPGTQTVSWTGTVTSVTITRPWRYI